MSIGRSGGYETKNLTSTYLVPEAGDQVYSNRNPNPNPNPLSRTLALTLTLTPNPTWDGSGGLHDSEAPAGLV